MTSLAVGCGLAELWMLGGGRFTAAELAAAELLLQLSVGEAEAEASPATTTCSRRSESSCSEDFAAEVERVVEEIGSPLRSTTTTMVELDTRATKRYRLLSELYATTRPVTPAAAAITAARKKRKRRQDESPPPPSSWKWKATRYDGDYRD